MLTNSGRTDSLCECGDPSCDRHTTPWTSGKFSVCNGEMCLHDTMQLTIGKIGSVQDALPTILARADLARTLRDDVV